MLSIVVLAENGGSDLDNCLASIVKQATTEAVEILVLDINASISEHDLLPYPGLRLIPCPGRRPAEARNLAIQAAQGQILCFTDDDCIPSEDWLAQLIAPFVDRGVAGVKGTYANASDGWLARFVQLEHELKYDHLRRQSTIDFVDMYSAAYRRHVLLANGCFDEHFGRLEEQDLSYRLAARGYKLVFQPQAKVARQHEGSIWGYASKKALIGYWKAQVIRRYPDRGFSDSYTPQTLRLQIGALLLALLSLMLLVASPLFLAGVLAAGLVFVATTLPFIAKAWKKDRAITATVLPMLALRATTLGSGYAFSLLYPPRQLSGKGQPISGLAYLSKRLVDLMGAVLGLALAAILTPFIALTIKIDSPGPVIFRQRRVGQGGRAFVMYKYRTMEIDAEMRLEEIVDRREPEEPVFKPADDPRITRAGRLLRRWSLDELPQFWNVLRGDMSLVGPRPEEERIVARYDDWHRRRLAVKPGMTGPMQIGGRADLTLDERVRLEIEYIQEYTLWRDMKILTRTIPAVLKGEGAR